uniref:D-aminoacyl-tRNA deacylase n=1 Tax=Anabaena sp. CCY 9402-a TaxID=3103867 RepID=UPI0039C61E60
SWNPPLHSVLRISGGRMSKNSGLRVEAGKFGAMMQVSIENDGPVTLILEKEFQTINQ